MWKTTFKLGLITWICRIPLLRRRCEQACVKFIAKFDIKFATYQSYFLIPANNFTMFAPFWTWNEVKMLNSTSQSVALEIIAMFRQRSLLWHLIRLLKLFSFSFWKQYKTDRKTLLSKDFSNISIQNQAYSQKQDAAITCSVFQGLAPITGISFQDSIQFSSAWNKNKPHN